jgi:hypothetical protein
MEIEAVFKGNDFPAIKSAAAESASANSTATETTSGHLSFHTTGCKLLLKSLSHRNRHYDKIHGKSGKLQHFNFKTC